MWYCLPVWLNFAQQPISIRAEIAKSQKLAGELLEKTPIAVQLRLAETAANAFSNGRSNLMIAPDASTASLMKMIGAGAAVFQASSAQQQNEADEEESTETEETSTD